MQSLSPGDPTTSWRTWRGEGVFNAVFVTRDGGSSFQRNCGQFQDQVCCQALHLRGACPALATEGGAKLPKEERNLSKEGLEDEEERVSHAPEGQPF